MVQYKSYENIFLYRLKRFLKTAAGLLITVSAVLFVLQYAVSPVRQEAASMEPVIPSESIVLVSPLWYLLHEPTRYDIASVRMGDGKAQIKRIIGLPGDTVLIKDGTVYVNGVPADAAYYSASIDIAGLASKEILLGEDEYFVLGDNPSRSEDSRFASIGNIQRKDLTGLCIFCWEMPFSFHLLTRASRNV